MPPPMPPPLEVTERATPSLLSATPLLRVVAGRKTPPWKKLGPLAFPGGERPRIGRTTIRWSKVINFNTTLIDSNVSHVLYVHGRVSLWLKFLSANINFLRQVRYFHAAVVVTLHNEDTVIVLGGGPGNGVSKRTGEILKSMFIWNPTELIKLSAVFEQIPIWIIFWRWTSIHLTNFWGWCLCNQLSGWICNDRRAACWIKPSHIKTESWKSGQVGVQYFLSSPNLPGTTQNESFWTLCPTFLKQGGSTPAPP